MPPFYENDAQKQYVSRNLKKRGMEPTTENKKILCAEHKNKHPHNYGLEKPPTPVRDAHRRGPMRPQDLPAPTGFVSPLSDDEWAEHYLKDKLLKGCLLYEVQREISAYLDVRPWAKVEIFRGAGKTTVILYKLLRRMCDDPEVRFCMQSENQLKTMQRVRVIRRELQTNEKIIEDYGYLPADVRGGNRYRGKWDEMQLELKREYNGVEPTLSGISWKDDNALGQHFTGVVLDDPWSIKNQHRTGDWVRFWNWWGEFMGCLEYSEFVWVTCTRKDREDIYSEWDADRVFSNMRQPLVVDWPKPSEYKFQYYKAAGGGQGGLKSEVEMLCKPRRFVHDECHGKYAIERVLVMRRRMKHDKFEREYQLNPIPPEGDTFLWSDVRWMAKESADPYARVPYEKYSRMKIIGVYDPAYGTSPTADFNAILKMGEYDGRFYILDSWVGRWNKKERIKNVDDFNRRSPGVPLYIESDYAQSRLVLDLIDADQMPGLKTREFSSRQKGVKYQQMFANQSKAAKKAKIMEGLEGAWSDRSVYLNPDLPDLRELETEVKMFPDCSKYDVLDALAMGLLVLRRRARRFDGGLSSGPTRRSPVPPAGRPKTFSLQRSW